MAPNKALTHIHVVTEGDTLKELSRKIYGDSDLYIHVARVNKLNLTRRLTPGTKLFFPPLVSE